MSVLNNCFKSQHRFLTVVCIILSLWSLNLTNSKMMNAEEFEKKLAHSHTWPESLSVEWQSIKGGGGWGVKGEGGDCSFHPSFHNPSHSFALPPYPSLLPAMPAPQANPSNPEIPCPSCQSLC
jgi:hypothetical protein